jgi:hypothetical protein
MKQNAVLTCLDGPPRHHAVQVFIQKAAVNLLSSVLDTPEFFWRAPDSFQALYERICEYLELEERVEVLNARFAVRGEHCLSCCLFCDGRRCLCGFGSGRVEAGACIRVTSYMCCSSRSSWTVCMSDQLFLFCRCWRSIAGYCRCCKTCCVLHFSLVTVSLLCVSSAAAAARLCAAAGAAGDAGHAACCATHQHVCQAVL